MQGSFSQSVLSIETKFLKILRYCKKRLDEYAGTLGSGHSLHWYPFFTPEAKLQLREHERESVKDSDVQKL